LTEEGSWLEQLIVTVCSSFALIQAAEVKSAVLPGRITVQQRRGPLGISRPNKLLVNCLTNCRGGKCLALTCWLASCQKGLKKEIKKKEKALQRLLKSFPNKATIIKIDLIFINHQYGV